MKKDSHERRVLTGSLGKILDEILSSVNITNFSEMSHRAQIWWGRENVKYHKKNQWLGRTCWNETNIGKINIVGTTMETADLFLKKINKEVGESAKILKEVYNEVNTTYGLLEPRLAELIHKIRTSRQTVTMELKQSLGIMKDVRKFFLDSDFNVEMERLESFVVLAERLKALIADGTMDAITDVILKLAIMEDVKDETERESV